MPCWELLIDATHATDATTRQTRRRDNHKTRQQWLTRRWFHATVSWRDGDLTRLWFHATVTWRDSKLPRRWLDAMVTWCDSKLTRWWFHVIWIWPDGYLTRLQFHATIIWSNGDVTRQPMRLLRPQFDEWCLWFDDGTTHTSIDSMHSVISKRKLMPQRCYLLTCKNFNDRENSLYLDQKRSNALNKRIALLQWSWY